ncbi:Hypothetical_protein [Hexamita inflata]|uniref:Hypothetical_protein n=1 Tax=Hexamita inflata TaxID=28002 RepID=A0AA86P6C4_9EUKA|nr:Hypothetical protein HINF_LOCUS20158 [Hexamita inflata]
MCVLTDFCAKQHGVFLFKHSTKVRVCVFFRAFPNFCGFEVAYEQFVDQNVRSLQANLISLFLLVSQSISEKAMLQILQTMSLRHVLKYLTNADIYEEDQVDNYQYITGSKQNSLPQGDLQSDLTK